MKQAWNTTRKLIISLVGFPLFIIGIILIPIPGPGLLISFLALILLSLEYPWAKLQLEKAKAAIKRIYAVAKARADKIESLADKK